MFAKHEKFTGYQFVKSVHSWEWVNERILYHVGYFVLRYEGWSKSSDRCLVALSRDCFERHAMHHSKDQVFTFIMMLICSRCTVSFHNYSTLHMVHSIPLAFFHIIELWWYLNLTLSSPASIKLQNKTVLSFYFLLLVMSIQMLEWRQVMSIQ